LRFVLFAAGNLFKKSSAFTFFHSAFGMAFFGLKNCIQLCGADIHLKYLRLARSLDLKLEPPPSPK